MVCMKLITNSSALDSGVVLARLVHSIAAGHMLQQANWWVSNIHSTHCRETVDGHLGFGIDFFVFVSGRLHLCFYNNNREMDVHKC